MNEQVIIKNEHLSFKDFLFKNKRNRTILIIAAIAIFIQFGIFKYFYPFANYIHDDSFSYLKSAFYNLSINTYLIGYSKFLRLFSIFSTSDIALTGFQYLFIESSTLFLLFTLFYFYKPRNIAQNILICFMLFNPLFFHLGNLISSDGFFVAISMIWLALLLWIIHSPSKKVILLHALVLFVAFTVRYNSLIYPFISVISFSLSRIPLKKKIVGAGLGIAMCILFTVFTSYQYKTLTGTWQYSPFSGWQLANNAMYTYRYVNKVDRKPVPKRFQALDNMIREYFDSTRDTKKFYAETLLASTVYMWTPRLSLNQYKEKIFKGDTSATEFKKWSSMGPLYKQYGIYIIKKYPSYFLRYFVWPNANKYYAPPLEFLEEYNSGKRDVTLMAKEWFRYKSYNVKTRTANNSIWILGFYPILSGIINLTMLCLLIFYIILKGWNHNKIFSSLIIMGSSIWLINAVFTIFSSSVALRFQAFPILITTTIVVLLFNWMLELVINSKKFEIGTKAKDKNVQSSHSNPIAYN